MILAKRLITLITFLVLLSTASYAQELKMMYLGHTGYTAKWNPGAKNQSAFNTGGIDLLITSDITEKLSAQGEFFLGFKGDGADQVPFNIERLYVKYAVNDYFNVRLGRMYTPLGFWNNKYTQGMIFQPTINRPYAVRNQNDKGIIATNSVGLQVDGENIGKLKFSYYLMIDNTTGAPSINTDNTTDKSVTAKLKIEPIENLQVFVSYRSDVIYAGGKSIQGTTMLNDVNQSIVNAGIAYFTSDSPLEVAFEYFQVTNDVKTFGKTTNNIGYAYLGYRIKNLTPYLQADLLNYDKNEKYFTVNNLTGMIIGARYSLAPSAILKMEYKYRGTDALYHQDVVSAQFAVRF